MSIVLLYKKEPEKRIFFSIDCISCCFSKQPEYTYVWNLTMILRNRITSEIVGAFSDIFSFNVARSNLTGRIFGGSLFVGREDTVHVISDVIDPDFPTERLSCIWRCFRHVLSDVNVTRSSSCGWSRVPTNPDLQFNAQLLAVTSSNLRQFYSYVF